MDLPNLLIFVLPVLSVWAGYGVALVAKPQNQNGVKLLLAFSGAFLLALTFFELLPKVYCADNSRTIAIYILIGILLQVFLEFFSKGAEHGHVHAKTGKTTFPVLLFLSLSAHAVIEGVPIDKGNNILYGILVHKFPVAIILGLFLIRSDVTKTLTLVFIALFSVMTPLGSFLASNTNWISAYGDQLIGATIGVFLHISTIILFESSQEHTFNLGKLVVILLGSIIAYFL